MVRVARAAPTSSGPRIVLELAAASRAELNAGKEPRAMHGEAAARTEARELVSQERNRGDRRHREVEHLGSLRQRVSEGNEDERGSGQQCEMPSILALVRRARVEHPERDPDGNPDGSEKREQIVRAQVLIPRRRAGRAASSERGTASYEPGYSIPDVRGGGGDDSSTATYAIHAS